MREKVIVKKKGCPKDDLPEKPVRSSFFLLRTSLGVPPRPGIAKRHHCEIHHRGRAQIPKINLRIMVYQGSQLDYVCGFPPGVKNPLNPHLLERNPENPDSSAD